MKGFVLLACLLCGGISILKTEGQPHRYSDVKDIIGTAKFNQIFINQTRKNIHKNNGNILRCYRLQSSRIVKGNLKKGWEFYARIFCGKLLTSDHHGKCFSKTCARFVINDYNVHNKIIERTSQNIIWNKISDTFKWFIPNWLKEVKLCLTCGKKKIIPHKVPYPTKLSMHSSYRYGYHDIDIALVNIRSQMCMIKDVQPKKIKSLFGFHGNNKGVDGNHSNVTIPKGDGLNLSVPVVFIHTKQHGLNNLTDFIQWSTFRCYLLWIKNQTTKGCDKDQLSFPMLPLNLCSYNSNLTPIMLKEGHGNITPESILVPYHQYAFIYLMTCKKDIDLINNTASPLSTVQIPPSSFYQYGFIYLLQCKQDATDNQILTNAELSWSITQSFWSNKFLFFISKEFLEIEIFSAKNLFDCRYTFIYMITCKEENHINIQTIENILATSSFWSHKFLFLISKDSRNIAEQIITNSDFEIETISYNMDTKYAFIYLMTCPTDQSQTQIIMEEKSLILSTHYQTIFIYHIHNKPMVYTLQLKDNNEIRRLPLSFWQNVFLYIITRTDSAEKFNDVTSLNLQNTLSSDMDIVLSSNFYQLKFLWILMNINTGSVPSLPLVINQTKKSLPVHPVYGTPNLPNEILSFHMKHNKLQWGVLNHQSKGQFSGNVDCVRLPQFTAMILALYILLRMLIHPVKWQTMPEPVLHKPGIKSPLNVGVIRPQFYEIETVVAVIDISPDDLYNLNQIN